MRVVSAAKGKKRERQTAKKKTEQEKESQDHAVKSVSTFSLPQHSPPCCSLSQNDFLTEEGMSFTVSFGYKHDFCSKYAYLMYDNQYKFH